MQFEMLSEDQVSKAILHFESMFPGSWGEVLRLKRYQYSEENKKFPDMEEVVNDIIEKMWKSFDTLEFVVKEVDPDRRRSISTILVGQLFAAADKAARKNGIN